MERSTSVVTRISVCSLVKLVTKSEVKLLQPAQLTHRHGETTAGLQSPFSSLCKKLESGSTHEKSRGYVSSEGWWGPSTARMSLEISPVRAWHGAHGRPSRTRAPLPLLGLWTEPPSHSGHCLATTLVYRCPLSLTTGCSHSQLAALTQLALSFVRLFAFPHHQPPSLATTEHHAA